MPLDLRVLSTLSRGVRMAGLVHLLLLLSVAFSSVCVASVVIHGKDGIVAQSHLNLFLDSHGGVWEFDVQNVVDWIRVPEWDPPVTVSEMKFWDANTLITMDDRMFYLVGANPAGGWHDAGFWPASSVPESEDDSSGTLIAAVPNPITDGCRVEFSLAATETVTIRVYDSSGRVVRDVFDGPCAAGSHSLTWDARDNDGRDLPAGVYLTRVATDSETLSTKVVVAR